MWIIFKVFISFVTILLLLFMFWFFGYKACEILVPLGPRDRTQTPWVER